MKYHFGVDLPHYFVCYLKGKPDVLVKQIRQLKLEFHSELNMDLHTERTSERERLNRGRDQEEDGVCRFKLKCPLERPESVKYLFRWLKQVTYRDVILDVKNFPTVEPLSSNKIKYWTFDNGYNKISTSSIGGYFWMLCDSVNQERRNDVRPDNIHLCTQQERKDFFQERQKEIDSLKAELSTGYTSLKISSLGPDKENRLYKRMSLIEKQVELMIIRYTGKTQNISPQIILNELLMALERNLIPVFENAEGLERKVIYPNTMEEKKGIVIDNEIYAEPQSPKYCFLFNDNYITRLAHQGYTSRTSPFVNIANADMPELWKLANQYSVLKSCYQKILAENEDANSSRCAIRLC